MANLYRRPAVSVVAAAMAACRHCGNLHVRNTTLSCESVAAGAFAVDWLGAMEHWVEDGTAPAQLPAARYDAEGDKTDSSR